MTSARCNYLSEPVSSSAAGCDQADKHFLYLRRKEESDRERDVHLELFILRHWLFLEQVVKVAAEKNENKIKKKI